MQAQSTTRRSPALDSVVANVSKTMDALLPVVATLAALAVGAIVLLMLGANPVKAYGALIEGAFGSANALAETAVKERM
jgi:simple sugar transport system permease protein